MSLRDLFEQARRLHLPSLWKSLGLKLRMCGHKGHSGFCPYCGPASHRDDATSLFQSSAGVWRWHCFRCGRHGTTVDLVAILERCSPAEAARKLASETLGVVPPTPPLPAPPAPRSDPEAVASIVTILRDYTRAQLHRDVIPYLEGRGITRSTQEEMAGRGLMLHLPGKPAVADAMLRTVVGTELLAAAGLIRDPAKPGFLAAAFRPLIFVSHDERAIEFRTTSSQPRGAKALQYGDPFAPVMVYPTDGRVRSIMLIEGAIDVMSAWQMFGAGHSRPGILFVGFFGTTKWRTHWLDALHIQHPDAEFLIATDNDKAGDEAAQAIREALPSSARCRRIRPAAGDWNAELMRRTAA